MAVETYYVRRSAGGTGDGSADNDTDAWDSLQAAFDALDGDSGHASNDLIIYCKDGGASSPESQALTNMSSWTSTPLSLTIIGEAGDSATWDSAKYTLVPGGSFATCFEIISARGDVTVRGLQLDMDRATYSVQMMTFTANGGTSGDNHIIERNIIRQSGSYTGGSNHVQFRAGTAGVNVYFRNNIIYDLSGNGIDSYQFEPVGNHYVHNNTVVNCSGTGITFGPAAAGTNEVRNNVVVDCGTDYGLSNIDTAGNNISSDGSASTTNDPPTFANKAGDDFSPENASDSMVGFGADLSGTFTDDFLGVTRSDWSAGAIEFVEANIDSFFFGQRDIAGIRDRFNSNLKR